MAASIADALNKTLAGRALVAIAHIQEVNSWALETYGVCHAYVVKHDLSTVRTINNCMGKGVCITCSKGSCKIYY
jgi:hypothetical protein